MRGHARRSFKIEHIGHRSRGTGRTEKKQRSSEYSRPTHKSLDFAESIQILDVAPEVDIHIECALEYFSQRPIAGWVDSQGVDCRVTNAEGVARRLSP